MASNYGQTSILSFKDEQQVRQRPSVIFGTNDEQGCIHGVYEIIANAIDEAREGFGNQIRISIYADNSIEVADDGRGVPMGWNESEQKFNWELVFCTLYASGKTNQENYAFSLGLNGLGATAMQYASEYMDVASTRDGKTSYMHFKKGRPVGKLEVKDTPGKKSGTSIRFKPDPEVFTSTLGSVVSLTYYVDKMRRQAMLYAGLEFVIWHEVENKKITLVYEDGIKGFIDSFVDKPFLDKTVQFEESTKIEAPRSGEKYPFKMNLALNFSRETPSSEIYHNGSLLYEGGVTFECFKAALTKAFEDHAKDISKMTKAERLQYRDIEMLLVVVMETNAPGAMTAFKNQTKAAVTNDEFKEPLMMFVYQSVRRWLANDKTCGERVLKEILVNKTAREEADRVSKKVVQSLSKSVTGLGNKVEKFVDCSSKVVAQREIYIVEGDSALGACKLARDSKFQGVIPIRGKIINCLKEDLTRILNSDIVIDLFRVFGCGIEAESKYVKDIPKFSITKLNWGKIVICTDADLDGMQIRCLLITMIYRLAPSLLKCGKVFIAETPLFEIEAKKETHFAYDEGEKDYIIDELINKRGLKESQIKIQRSKGLGENEPDMMNKSTMNPLTRRLIPVEYNEDQSELISSIFNALLGDDIESRRALIEEYFAATEVSID